MASFGQGNSVFMTGEDAVSIARDNPVSPGSEDTYLVEENQPWEKPSTSCQSITAFTNKEEVDGFFGARVCP